MAQGARNVMVCRRFILAILLPFWLSPELPAQENPCLNRTFAVSVTTQGGELVKGLGVANFHGKFRGKPVQVSSAVYDTGPRRVVIVLDASSSMFESWTIELTVAKNLISSSPAENSFALLTFASQVEDRIDFSQGSKAVVSGLAMLEAKDWRHYKGPARHTDLFDSLVAALNLLRPVRVGDVIYVISDGGDNSSRTQLPVVKGLLLAAGVRLFGLITIDLVGRRRPTPEEATGLELLRQLIEATGGDSVTFVPGMIPLASYPVGRYQLNDRDREIMSMASLGFGREISEYYRLELKLPQEVEKVRDWKLDVTDRASKKNPRLRVIYPHLLTPCQ